MFKQFLTPLSRLWEKTLKDHKLPANLRSTLLIFFAVAIVQISMFGAAFLALILLVKVLK